MASRGGCTTEWPELDNTRHSQQHPQHTKQRINIQYRKQAYVELGKGCSIPVHGHVWKLEVGGGQLEYLTNVTRNVVNPTRLVP